MSILIDEFGRPIILFDPQDTKKRIKGMEAYKVNIYLKPHSTPSIFSHKNCI